MKDFLFTVSILGWLPDDASVFVENHLKTIADLPPKEWRAKIKEVMSLTNEMVRDDKLRYEFQGLLFESKELALYKNKHWEELKILIEGEQNAR